MKRFVPRLMAVGWVLLVGALIGLLVSGGGGMNFALAQDTTLQGKEFDSLVTDGAAVTSTNYYRLMAGLDASGNAQAFLVTSTGAFSGDTELPAAAALGDAVANPTTPMVGAALMGWSSSPDNTWGRLLAQNSNADDEGVTGSNVALQTMSVLYAFDRAGADLDRVISINAADGITVIDGTDDGLLGTYAVLAAFDGMDYERLRVDASRNLLVALGTNIDFTNDSITAHGPLADDAAFTHGTTRVQPFGGVFDETLSNDPEENDIAAGRIDAKRAWVHVLESAATRGLYSEVLTAGADDTANTTNGLFTYSVAMVYDSTTGANLDRLTKFEVRQAGVPGANVQLGVDSTSSCTAALTVGTTYRIKPVAVTESTAYCCRSGTSCTAVTTDAPYSDGEYYFESVTDAAANDVICCLASSGTNSILLNVTPMAF